MKRTLPLILLAIGIVMMVVAMVLGVRGVADAVSSTTEWTSSETPQQVSLTQGEWELYEEVISPSPLARAVTPAGITVTGPSGSVPVSDAGVTTVTINNRTFAAAARFTVPSDATYEISVTPAGSNVVVGRSVGATVFRTFAFVGLLTLGGLLAFIGVIWLIVGFIVSRSRKTQPLPAGQWYPDPEDPTQWRWWDGRNWTDHRTKRQ